MVMLTTTSANLELNQNFSGRLAEQATYPTRARKLLGSSIGSAQKVPFVKLLDMSSTPGQKKGTLANSNSHTLFTKAFEPLLQEPL